MKEAMFVVTTTTKAKLSTAIGFFFLYWGLNFGISTVCAFIQVFQLASETNLPIDYLISSGQVTGFSWYFVLLSTLSFVLILWLSKRKGLTFFSFKPIPLKDLAFTVLMFIGMLATTICLNLIAINFIPGFENTANEMALDNILANTAYPLFFFYAVILAPISEEVIVRGFFLKYFFPHNRKLGWLLSALLFGMLHGPTDIISFLIYASMGAFLGGIYYQTGRIELAILAHFANNLLSML